MSLPQPFAGTPANVGARLVAFTIDAILVAVVGIAAWLLVTPALALVVVVEALLGLWIMQARLGSSPGAVMLGVRVARDDAPFSPGAGRAFVRGSLLLVGALVLLAGAWILVATAAWDRSGRRRSWIDKAAQTIVVAVPARTPSAEAYALASPTIMGRSSSAPARPADVAGSTPAALPLAPAWGVAAFAPAAAPLTAAPAAAPAPAVAQPVAQVPLGAAAPPTPTSAPSSSAQLLVMFDTGQRVQFALPVAVNFGRSPVATEPGDALVVVDDPDRMVSKTHLRLEHDGENAWVIDAGSTNGSELVDDDGSGRVLAPGIRTALDDGVRVRVGERVFTVSRLIGGPA
jgi:uncharacterized RDD family membrane protein YckC